MSKNNLPVRGRTQTGSGANLGFENQTLEAMARAIFKSWFVDFDPVWEKMKRKDAKAQGRKDKDHDSSATSRPGVPALPSHILDLFPDSFEDSEIGEIPKGWEVVPLFYSYLVVKPSEKLSEYFGMISDPIMQEIKKMMKRPVLSPLFETPSFPNSFPVNCASRMRRSSPGRQAYE